jgi:uncharacterized membrane protein
VVDRPIGTGREARVNTYLWLKLVHVLAAITALGANLTYFVWLTMVRRSSDHSAYVLNGVRRLDARVANPAYVVLPITGILMVLDADLGFTTFWIAAGIILYVTMGVFAGIFFAPALRRQVALAEAGPVDEAVYEQAARRTTVTGIITVAIIVVIVYMMVMKPTA